MALSILEIYNYIWQWGDFPDCWSEATIIPIPKPGKDHSDPNNYRPIALTSCVCWTLERMTNDRFVWYLESNNTLTNIQCGFRKRRSTLDHLVRWESFIRDAFLNKQEVVSVFFDLEKAYDTTWKGSVPDQFEGANACICFTFFGEPQFKSAPWVHPLWPIRTRDGCSTGQHFIGFFIKFKNKQLSKSFK